MLRPIVRLLTMVTTEIVKVARQPILVLALVLGPFLILFIFGIGHRDARPPLRTVLVIPPGIQLSRDPAYWSSQFGGSVDVVGVTSDEAMARSQLQAQQIDLAVVIPADAGTAFAAGHSAVVQVYSNTLDPVNQSYIQFTGYVLATELNKRVIAELAQQVQADLKAKQAPLNDLQNNLNQLQATLQSGDIARAHSQIAAARQNIARLQADLAVENQFVTGAAGTLQGNQTVAAQAARLQQTQNQLATLDTELSQLDSAVSTDPRLASARIAQTQADLTKLNQLIATVTVIPPDVLASPFVSNVTSLATLQPTYVQFYSPGVLALLLQHLAITVTALSLVRERLQGTSELYQVAPTSTFGVLLGKFLSYFILGLVVAAALAVLMIRLLAVPFRGDLALIGLTVVLLLFASLTIGLTLSLLATSQENAVQYSMLVLLASVFFSGFFLPLDTLKLPAIAVSYILPVTYGIQALQDLMLRGVLTSSTPLIALGAMGVLFSLLSIWLLNGELRRK